VGGASAARREKGRRNPKEEVVLLEGIPSQKELFSLVEGKKLKRGARGVCTNDRGGWGGHQIEGRGGNREETSGLSHVDIGRWPQQGEAPASDQLRKKKEKKSRQTSKGTAYGYVLEGGGEKGSSSYAERIG